MQPCRTNAEGEESTMLTRRMFASCALCAATALVATEVAAQTTLAGVKRTILQQTDGPSDGYVSILARVEIEAGTQVMRHTHPGVESTFVLAGGGTLSVHGQPDKQLSAGDGFQVPAYVPHALRNGDQPSVLAITYVVEKGKPLVTPAPA
jgi:quercetin dioxygenase-like cupin family protein